MKTFWILKSILMVAVVGRAHGEPPGLGGGLLFRLFEPILNIPESQGEKIETILPPVVREHHEHVWIKKPHLDIQKSESFEKQQKQILHNHVTLQKVIHKNHHHQHVLNEHTQHNIHTHNLHNQIHHVHEITKEEEHIHKPVYHEHEHHQHKVTSEKIVKHTEDNKEKHTHEKVVTSVQAPPIHQKEWSFLGWLRAWVNW